LVELHGETLAEVAIKLKGAAGSFQELDGKPAFTLNVGKFMKKQTFHRLTKFYLNNSVQDETYTSEWLCASICKEAGIPAPRITHARVWLNDRDLGMYILKEGFDAQFLRRNFRNSKGNFYDGGFCQEIDVDLEKDEGFGPNDHSDLRALVAACQLPEIDERKAQVAKLLDVAQFHRFMAFELMACHWDGYVASRNNYRVYFDPSQGKARFLPHGMDQMFQDPNFPVFEHFPALVAQAARCDDEWNSAYRERVREMLPFFDGAKLGARVEKLHRLLRPEIAKMNPDGVSGFDEQLGQWKERLVQRTESIARQLTEPDPPPRPPEGESEELDGIEPVALGDWYPAQETADAHHETAEEPGERPAEIPEGEEIPAVVVYSIVAGESGDCVASWRKRVRLHPGRYHLTARMRVEGVAPRGGENPGVGAGLRISGGQRDNGLEGTSDWNNLVYEFAVVEDPQEVELVAELRGKTGRMWFAAPVLKRVVD
ncbi:MAG: CotH kinase family protein, partial [Planctomycetota bacterium]|nr:CotH kinase family protein [Planctomycetota bacterium]